MKLPALEDLSKQLGGLSGKKILVRVNYDVPIEDGQVTDDFRIQASMPTIQWLTEAGAELTLCSHLGRPGGEPNPEFSLDPVRERLSNMGVKAKLLPNLRFSPGEKTNDAEFAATLTNGMDGYVNDAFGVCHRTHASVVAAAQNLPRAAGRSVAGEVNVLHKMIQSPGDNFVAVMGGLKISDKLRVVESILDKVDALCVGGAMAYTFLKAQGVEVGASLVEDSMVDKCKELLGHSTPIHLPVDFVALAEDGIIGQVDDAEVRTFTNQVDSGWSGADVGPETSAKFAEIIEQASTVFWNGPLGAFEDPRFSSGTAAMADTLAEASGYVVIGGGDSAAAAAEFGVADQVDHVCTGGGAALGYIEDPNLPGLAALMS